MNKTSVLILFLVSVVYNAGATVFFPNLLHYRTFTENFSTKIYFIVPLGEEGFLVGGNHNYNEFMIKTDRLGRVLWDFDNAPASYPDYSAAGCAASDGKYLLAGTSKVRSDSTYSSWYQIIRITALNVAGTKEWQKEYRDTMYNVPVGMVEMDDGSFMVGGNVFSRGSADKLLLLKVDATGGFVWRKCYGIDGQSAATCATIKRPDGNALIAAYKFQEKAAWLLNVNNEGDTLWTRTMFLKGGCKLSALQQTSDGNCIGAGTVADLTGKTDFFVVKIDQSGKSLWFKTYDRYGNDSALAIDTVPGGGFCFAGSGGGHCIMMRIGPEGDSLWTVDYHAGEALGATSMAVGSDGRFFVAGISGKNRDTYGGFMMVFENERSSTKPASGFSEWEILDSLHGALPTNDVRKVEVDANNRLWAIVRSADKLQTSYQVLYRKGNGWVQPDSIPPQNFSDITASADGAVWITNSSRIYRTDGVSTRWVEIDDGYFGGIAPVDSATAFTGYLNGVAKIDLAGAEPMTPIPEATDFLTSPTVTDVVLDRNGSLWYLPFFGVALKSDDVVIHYTKEITGGHSFRGRQLCMDRLGTLWIGSDSGVVHHANGIWEFFDPVNAGLPSYTITALAVDSSCEAYAATVNGIYHLKQKKIFSYETTPLPSNNIRSLAFGLDSTLWIATDKGIAALHPHPVAVVVGGGEKRIRSEPYQAAGFDKAACTPGRNRCLRYTLQGRLLRGRAATGKLCGIVIEQSAGRMVKRADVRNTR